MNWSIPITVDLGAGRRPVRGVLNEVLAHPNNNLAHSIEFTVMRNGVAENLAGASAVAYCVREDGTAVYRPGVISGNKVTVLLSQACYAQKGKLRIVAQLTHPTDGLMSLADFVISIAQPIPGTIVDDSHIIHDIAEIVALYDSLNALNQLCANNEQTRTLNETNRQVNEQLREVAEDERSAAEAARSVFEAWNSGKAYVVGNKVAKDGSSYVCIAPNTNQAPPNATYWLLIAAKGDNTTASAVSTAGGSNVQAALNSLESRATDLESTASEHASQLADTADNAALWRTATGNPATIYPVPKSRLYPRIELVATQEGEGDPSPENVRPIVPSLAAGQKVKAKRTGKNLIGVTGFTLHKASARTKAVMLNTRLQDANYTLSFDVSVNTLSLSFRAACYLGVTLKKSFVFSAGAKGRLTASITGSGEYDQIYFFIQNEDVDTATISLDNIQLELGSTATSYEPYSGAEYDLLTAEQDFYGLPDAPVVVDAEAGTVTVQDAGAKWLDAWSPSNTITVPNAEYACVNITGGNMPQKKPMVENVWCNMFAPVALAPGIAQEGVWSNSTGDVGVVVALSRLAAYGATGDRSTHPAAVKTYFNALAASGAVLEFRYTASATQTIPFTPPPIPALDRLSRTEARQNVLTVTANDAPVSKLDVTYQKSPIRESDEIAAAIAALA